MYLRIDYTTYSSQNFLENYTFPAQVVLPLLSLPQRQCSQFQNTALIEARIVAAGIASAR